MQRNIDRTWRGLWHNYGTGSELQHRIGSGRCEWNLLQGNIVGTVGSRFASRRWNAYIFFVSQISFFAITTDGALSGAPRSGQGHGAGGDAGRTAGAVFFIFATFGWWRRVELRNLHIRDVRHRIAFLRTHANAIGGFQISFFAETTVDAW